MIESTIRSCYLDYNATAPIKPEVVERMAAALSRVGNPSSVHRWGRWARRAVEDARAGVGELVGCVPERIVFTSGGTEANNLAVSCRPRVLASAVEHVSVLEAAPGAVLIPVDSSGIVELDALRRLLAETDGPAVVSVMLANNETGAVQPVERVVEIAREFGALCHCDAVQVAGKRSLSMDELGVDLFVRVAHKLGGPQGVGALAVGRQVQIPSLLRGGSQERGHRAGTENVAGIVGFGVAAALCGDDDMAAISRIRDRIERHVMDSSPSATILAADVERIANTSCLSMAGVSSETQVMAFDLAGIAVSAGAACSSGKVSRSHVLTAMGCASTQIDSAIRVSLGWATNESDVDRFLDAWDELRTRTLTGSERKIVDRSHSRAAAT